MPESGSSEIAQPQRSESSDVAGREVSESSDVSESDAGQPEAGRPQAGQPASDQIEDALEDGRLEGTGSANGAPERGPTEGPAPEGPVASEPGRLRRALVTSSIVVMLLLLAGVAGAGLYVKSIELPSLLDFPASTTLYYSDGKTVLAQLGEVQRTEVPVADLIPEVQQVAVAADDPDFYTDSGGPIARSVARTSLDLRGSGVSTRLRVAISARKLDGSHSKEELLGRYLNDSLFGRVTYGIEAAAREYFGKTADKRATDLPRLTMAEAMVLVAMLRQPVPDPAGGRPGYDPSSGPLAEKNSRNRFNEISASMVALRYLTRDQANALTYPATVRPDGANARISQLSRPVGMVVSQVLSELTRTASSPLRGKAWRSISNAGYGIVTTIDVRAQRALERVADDRASGSVMAGQPPNLQAAGVLVEPGTGRVLGYYGGSDGRGADYAGVYFSENGDPVGFGAHAPGSSFEVQTLATALRAGISLNSYWQWTPHDMPGRVSPNQIRNTSTCPSDVDKSGACSLLDSTTASINVTFYGLTVSVTPAKVLEMARDAGIDNLWTEDRSRVDLTQAGDMTAVAPSKFDTIVGIGQYPVTVVDQANAMATYAAGGLRARAHFVARVMDGEHLVYGESLPTADQPRVLNQSAIADLDYALSRAQSGNLRLLVRDRSLDSAAKTGAWSYSARIDQNTDAWMIGYTGSLAMAVWIGDRKIQGPILDSRGATISGSGLPATIYRDVMSSVHEAMGLTPAAFPPPALVGNARPPGSVSPPGTAQPSGLR